MLSQINPAQIKPGQKFPSKEPLTDSVKAAAALMKKIGNGASDEPVQRQLVMLAKASEATLSKVFSESDEQTRIRASIVLSTGSDESMVSLLQKMADDENIYVRGNARAALRKMGVIEEVKRQYQI